MSRNSQAVRTLFGKKYCKWCFSTIDESTGRCKKMCIQATNAKRIDEAMDELDKIKEQLAKDKSTETEQP